MTARDYTGYTLHIGDLIDDGHGPVKITALGDCIHGMNAHGEDEAIDYKDARRWYYKITKEDKVKGRINTEALEAKIKEQRKGGLSKGDIAKALGITPTTLSQKLGGKSDFTVSEAYQIYELLGLSRNEFDAIFYAPKVDYMPTTEAEA